MYMWLAVIELADLCPLVHTDLVTRKTVNLCLLFFKNLSCRSGLAKLSRGLTGKPVWSATVVCALVVGARLYGGEVALLCGPCGLWRLKGISSNAFAHDLLPCNSFSVSRTYIFVFMRQSSQHKQLFLL